MNSNVNRARALKGYLKLSAVSYRRPVLVFASFLGGALLFGLVMSAYAAMRTTSGTGETSTGAMMAGFLAAAITLFIMGFQSTSDRSMAQVFSFPLNRQVYALGNFLTICGLALSLTYVMGVIGGMEAFLGRLIASRIPQMLFVSNITIAGFVLGFWLTLSYLTLFMSSSYTLGMYFYRFKLATIAVGGLALLVLIVFPATATYIERLFSFFILEESPLALSMKIWGSVLVLHAVALLPLNRMEVKA